MLVSFETFVVTGLIVLYLTSTDPFYSQLANTIFSTWVAALFTILPSYLVFAGVAQMVRNRSLVAVLLPIALELGFLIFISTSVAGFGGTFTFASFFDFLVGVTTSKTSAATISALTSLSILVPSVAVLLLSARLLDHPDGDERRPVQGDLHPSSAERCGLSGVGIRLRS